MKIGIIGGGVVGRATARSFMEFHEVMVYDIVPERRSHSFDEVVKADIVFLCLPTPQSKTGFSADISYLDAVLAECPKNGYYVIKSTVPVGTTSHLGRKHKIGNLLHSPEFLTARCAVTDAQLPSRNIIGGSYGMRSDRVPLTNLYASRFPGVPILQMNSDESEAVKLILNSFFAVKIAFFNEAFSLCNLYDMSWNAVLEGVLTDGRIAYSHTQVPGPDGRYGFGGACLPKDLHNFIDCIERVGGEAIVARGASERNVDDRHFTIPK